MSHHIIEVIDLNYSYPDGTEALRGISFTLLHGESVALIGGNGAGKSTLLMHMNGSLIPNQGEIRIGHTPVVKSTLDSIRRTVGMVFQNPEDQLFMPTVQDDIAFGPMNLGLPPEEVEQRVTHALREVNLEHLRHKSPYRLSSGEKRSIAIATVLAMEPDVLIMDEPSANLDPSSRRILIRQLQSFQHSKIIATHDLELVLDVCERTLILKEGKIVADGATHELLQNKELLESCHLELPCRFAPSRQNQ